MRTVPWLAPSLKGALWHSAFVAFAGRVVWFFRQFPTEDWLEALAFVAYAMPGVLLLISLVGIDRATAPRRYLQQQWASWFLGWVSIGVYVVHQFLPGLWPFALFVPTAWLFRPLWRVKADEPGAIEAFQADERVENVKEAFRSFVDLFERPGWRERAEAGLREEEKADKAARSAAWARSHPRAAARLKAAREAKEAAKAEARAARQAKRDARAAERTGTEVESPLSSTVKRDGDRSTGAAVPISSDDDELRGPSYWVFMAVAMPVALVFAGVSDLWDRHGGPVRRVPLALRIAVVMAGFSAGISAVGVWLLKQGYPRHDIGAGVLMMAGPLFLIAMSFAASTATESTGRKWWKRLVSAMLAAVTVGVFLVQAQLPRWAVPVSAVPASLLFWPFWHAKLRTGPGSLVQGVDSAGGDP